MARLFISFYLFIALSLIGLAALLNSVFFNDSDAAGESFAPLIHTLQQIRQHEPNAFYERVQQAGWEHALITRSALALSPSLQQQLQRDNYLLVHDERDAVQVYFRVNNDALLRVQLRASEQTDASLWLYSSVFFLVLAGLIGIWLWPLWRDLTALKVSAESLQPDGSLSAFTVRPGSALAPIATAFNALCHQVKDLLQTQRELTGAVAHEWRTPLARMKFALANDVNETRWHDLNKDVNELEQLVQEMLDYASMETATPELNFGTIPVHDLLQQVSARLQSTSDKTINIAPSAIEFSADAHFIERAVQNIVSNALRYTNTKVRLSAVELDNTIHILCDDDGPGVPESERERIFDAFYRPDTSRDRRRGGAGLGLAIVKRIQRWHDGDCWVEASPLGGARFVLRYLK